MTETFLLKPRRLRRGSLRNDARMPHCLRWGGMASLLGGLGDRFPQHDRDLPSKAPPLAAGIFTVALHIHGDLLQQHAYDFLPILCGGLGRRPQARQVLRYTPDGVAFAQGALGGLCTAEPRIRFVLVLCMTQGLFPLPLQLTPHQPVFGLDGVRLTRGSFGTVVGSLSALLPMGLQVAALGS